MTLDGRYTATVDRIEGDLAVLLVEADDGIADERHLPVEDLPAEADEGAVCELTFEDDELVGIVEAPDETESRRDRLREKFDRLSRRLDDE